MTVTVSSGDTGAATVSPASLSFTAVADYGTSQTVTVIGAQDDDSSNESTSVSLSASGGDYDSVSSSVSVEVTDDDTQGLVLQRRRRSASPRAARGTVTRGRLRDSEPTGRR